MYTKRCLCSLSFSRDLPRYSENVFPRGFRECFPRGSGNCFPGSGNVFPGVFGNVFPGIFRECFFSGVSGNVFPREFPGMFFPGVSGNVLPGNVFSPGIPDLFSRFRVILVYRDPARIRPLLAEFVSPVWKPESTIRNTCWLYFLFLPTCISALSPPPGLFKSTRV